MGKPGPAGLFFFGTRQNLFRAFRRSRPQAHDFFRPDLAIMQAPMIADETVRMHG